jgi:hypothetical protein
MLAATLDIQSAERAKLQEQRKTELIFGKHLPSVPEINTTGSIDHAAFARPFASFPSPPPSDAPPNFAPPSPPGSIDLKSILAKRPPQFPVSSPPEDASVDEIEEEQEMVVEIVLPEWLNLSDRETTLVRAMCDPSLALLRALCTPKHADLTTIPPSTLAHVNSVLKVLEHTETLVVPFLERLFCFNHGNYFTQQLALDDGMWTIRPFVFPKLALSLQETHAVTDVDRRDVFPALVVKQFLLQHGRFFLEKSLQPFIAHVYQSVDANVDDVNFDLAHQVAKSILAAIIRHRGLLPR